ncbi:MAG TPA: hypothetical protein ENN73_06895 [Firmicutes bacterium]|nr:hypothetical protein [Bacillota bacterium]
MTKPISFALILLSFSFIILGCRDNFNLNNKKIELTLIAISNRKGDSFAVFRDTDGNTIYVASENKDYNFTVEEYYLTFIVFSSPEIDSGKNQRWKVGEKKSFKLRGQDET